MRMWHWLQAVHTELPSGLHKNGVNRQGLNLGVGLLEFCRTVVGKSGGGTKDLQPTCPPPPYTYQSIALSPRIRIELLPPGKWQSAP
eukprot:1161868-Pelagomonas_calceolata.AAC.8